MKPKIGRKVYCIYYGYSDGAILVENVGWLGKESFIVENFDDTRNFDSLEWFYREYEQTWFTSLAKAKKALFEQNLDINKTKYKLVKVYDDYYEIQEKE